MTSKWTLGLAAALSWAMVGPLLHLTLPMARLQAWGMALLFAFFLVRGGSFVRGTCEAKPWQSPAAVLGLGALLSWGAHLLTETTHWNVSASAWWATLGLSIPLALAATAWRNFAPGPARASMIVLAMVAYVLGDRFI